MPLVRKDEIEDLISDALGLLDEGALHQGIGALVALALRLARAGRKKPELEQVAATVSEVLKRTDLPGMTAAEDADLRSALAAVQARLAALP